MAIADFLGGGALGAFLALGVVFIILGIAQYIYMAIALMAIAKKTNTPNGWLAFIPIANIYLITQIGGLPGWWTLGVLLPIIPFVGQLGLLVLIAYMFWKVSEVVNRPGWWGILMLIPIVNLIIIGIMAWGKSSAAVAPAKPAAPAQ